MGVYRLAVSVMPKEGILDPQGRAVEAALPQLGAASVHNVRVGRRIEMTVEADDALAARDLVEKLAAEFLANPLIEGWSIQEAHPEGVA
jgi:phosphoribosylformylglycinamidine synthase